MIESSYFWTNVFILAIGTISIRGSLIAMSSRIKISPRIRDLFSYIPASILPAFIAPAVYFNTGSVSWLFEKERLVILLLAGFVCYKTKSTLATICFGLITLYLIHYVI